MAYGVKAYTLREESTRSGTKYFISFKDGQGEQHELEVSERLFLEFRQMERKNRNLQQWNQRHREFNEVWDETLNSQYYRHNHTKSDASEKRICFYTKQGGDGGIFIGEDYKPYINTISSDELKILCEIYAKAEGIQKKILLQIIHKYGSDKLEL